MKKKTWKTHNSEEYYGISIVNYFFLLETDSWEWGQSVRQFTFDGASANIKTIW